MYCIVEFFGGPTNAQVIIDDNQGDPDGDALLFDTEQQADDYAVENCQKDWYTVVEL